MKKVFVFFIASMSLYLLLALFVWFIWIEPMPFREIAGHPLMLILGITISATSIGCAVDEMK